MDMLRIVDVLIFPAPDPKLLIVRHFVVQPGATTASDQDGLNARNAPNSVAIQADVKMLLCVLSNAGTVFAGVILYGFNDGTPGLPTDRTGDIFARLRITCAQTNQATITWDVSRCKDASCTTTALGTGTFGGVSLGQELTLNIKKEA